MAKVDTKVLARLLFDTGTATRKENVKLMGQILTGVINQMFNIAIDIKNLEDTIKRLK